MKLLLFFTCAILIFSCSQNNNNPSKIKPLGKGGYKGNVYWQYNKYVGNRPDAGATVTVYSLNDTSKMYFTKTDVRGDFLIDSLPEGLYLSIIQSKNTTASPQELYEEIKLNSQSLSKITGYDIEKEIKNYDTIIQNLDSLSSASLTNIKSSTSLKSYYKYKDSLNSVCSLLIRNLPKEVKWKISVLTPYSSKVAYHLISISPNKTENKIVDFGITYM